MVSACFAGNALLLIFGCLFIFHVLVLTKVIPFNIVWAGKIKNRNELVKMESASLLILVASTVVVALQMGYLNFFKNLTIINLGMWILFAFFTLNTLGNLTAKSPVEKYGFGTLTTVMALLALTLAAG